MALGLTQWGKFIIIMDIQSNTKQLEVNRLADEAFNKLLEGMKTQGAGLFGGEKKVVFISAQKADKIAQIYRNDPFRVCVDTKGIH